MEIHLIIRELLAKHNYISLPGIGSFVQKYEPAKPSTDGLSFIPPRQVISFDTSRDFNDEAIENHLCEKFELSHSEASNKLNAFIKELTNKLNQGEAFLFENVGTLSKDSNGKFQFTPIDLLDSATSTYGLNEISVSKTISTKVESKVAQSSKNIVDHKNESSSKVFVVIISLLGAAAIIAAFVFIPDLRFWEKYITSKNQQTVALPDTSKKPKITQQTIAKIDSSLNNKKDSVRTKIDKEIADNSQKKTALYYEEPKKQDSKTYYLIVGSFGKIENAQKLSEKFAKKGFKPQIIQGANMYRVSIDQFNDKNEAIAEFNKFRAQNPNESIWLLGQ